MNLAPVPVDDRVRALLVAAGLPIDDLDDAGVHLYGATEGATLAGVVGLQVAGGAGLLRSLAVDPAYRDRGLGTRLCDLVVAEARARSLGELWLLTQTARDYFARRGFEVVARDQVPPPLRATAQFSSLCPSTAVAMRLSRAAPAR
ncbi:MAG: arsenic resistance N-acetyltransferase ArsN2 [Acidobacteriota bacterium]